MSERRARRSASNHPHQIIPASELPSSRGRSAAARQPRVRSQRELEREQRENDLISFEDWWETAQYKGESIPMAENWDVSVERWLDRGLELQDLIDSFYAAFTAPRCRKTPQDWWLYGCRVCWQKVHLIAPPEDEERVTFVA